MAGRAEIFQSSISCVIPLTLEHDLALQAADHAQIEPTSAGHDRIATQILKHHRGIEIQGNHMPPIISHPLHHPLEH